MVCDLVQSIERELFKKQGIVDDNYDGSSFLKISIEMVEILLDLKLDQNALCAALIYRYVRKNYISLIVIEERLGAEISGLIQGVLGMATITKSLSTSTGCSCVQTNQT